MFYFKGYYQKALLLKKSALRPKGKAQAAQVRNSVYSSVIENLFPRQCTGLSYLCVVYKDRNKKIQKLHIFTEKTAMPGEL